MPEITIISMYNGRQHERVITRAKRLRYLLVDGRVVYDDELDESGEHMHMQRANPIDDRLKERGFISAVFLDKKAVASIKSGKITHLILFGDKIGAIIDEGIGSGESILIQTPDGKQAVFPVGYLLNAFNSTSHFD